MAYTTLPPDDFAQRLSKMRRLVNAMSVALDALERDMLEQQRTQPDGERAAAEARRIVYRQGPQEVKVIRD